MPRQAPQDASRRILLISNRDEEFIHTKCCATFTHQNIVATLILVMTAWKRCNMDARLEPWGKLQPRILLPLWGAEPGGFGEAGKGITSLDE